jgi:curved DNA-binding protein CbpA
MPPNRRNLYRLLQVQPDAPLPVIKASYRVIMSSLRAHPDLGGDEEQAALINLAYSVLSDPDKRAAYDRLLAPKLALQRRSAPTPAAPEVLAALDDRLGWRERGQCPMCRQGLPSRLDASSACLGCGSPLMPAPTPDAAGRELFGRRASERLARDQPLTVQLVKNGAELPARWRDVSLTGMSFFAPIPLPPGQVLRIRDVALDGLAQVIGSRPQGKAHLTHARLLTTRFLQARGQFLSVEA